MSKGVSSRELLEGYEEESFEENINVKVVRFNDGDADAGPNIRKDGLAPSKSGGNSLSLRHRLQRVGPDAFNSARRSIQRLTRNIVPADTILTGHWWRFSEVLDPRSTTVIKWQKIFLTSCFVGIYVDPMFFFLPVVISDKPELMRVDLQMDLAISITVLRTFVDLFYLVHMFMQCRIAYIEQASRTFGRGDLVLNKNLIRIRYLKRKLLLDVIAVLPLPQVTLWGYFYRTSGPDKTKNILRWLVLIQYFPRLHRIFSLWRELQKTSGIVATTAWAGAFLNLLLYLLFSHVLSAMYYALAVERADSCWREWCAKGNSSTIKIDKFWDFNTYNCSIKSYNCTIDPDNSTSFDYGIYGSLLAKEVPKKDILTRYFWTFWWGLQSLSSVGQGLQPSTYVLEALFCIFIAIMGLTLFALLVGNIQTYLSSVSMRLEEMRLKRRDTEQWMHHRSMPMELRDRVRRYDSLKWLATNGVDEEDLMKNWPEDLRRDVKRHLCLDLVRKVPLFKDMDDVLLDAICIYLQPALFTEGTIALRDDDRVTCMYFIIRGKLRCHSIDGGGYSGFCGTQTLESGNFFGDELLTWALDPNPREVLPISTRLIETLSEVECFALYAGDLKLVASQYRRHLHSRKLQHVFRAHSHQWRTWAARCIQAAWRRYRKRSLLLGMPDDLLNYPSSPNMDVDMMWPFSQLVKPDEPDFSDFKGPEAEDVEAKGEDQYGTYSSAQATPRIGGKHLPNVFSTRSGPIEMWHRGSAMASGPLDGRGELMGRAGRTYRRNYRRRGMGNGEGENQDEDDGIQVGLTGPL